MKPQLFDTHCHLNLVDSFPDPSPFFERARDVGVTRLALVGLDPATGRRALEMAEPLDGVYAIVGRHPNYAAHYVRSELDEYREMLSHEKAVAMGELGLDYHWDFASKDQQLRCLTDQLDLAAELEVPVVFHCREAYADLLDLLESRPAHPYLFHCFSGNADDARRAAALGCCFGFDGPLTYKKSDALRELVKKLPTDRIVLETDSPYMAPAPQRGKPNEPSYLPLINEALAQVLGIGVLDCAGLTTRNALRFFRIALDGDDSSPL